MHKLSTLPCVNSCFGVWREPLSQSVSRPDSSLTMVLKWQKLIFLVVDIELFWFESTVIDSQEWCMVSCNLYMDYQSTYASLLFMCIPLTILLLLFNLMVGCFSLCPCMSHVINWLLMFFSVKVICLDKSCLKASRAWIYIQSSFMLCIIWCCWIVVSWFAWRWMTLFVSRGNMHFSL